MATQGDQKRKLKSDVFRKLLLWALKKDVQPNAPQYFSKPFGGSDLSRRDDFRTIAMLDAVKDSAALTRMRKHWLEGSKQHEQPWKAKLKSKPFLISDHHPTKPGPMDASLIPVVLQKQEARKRGQLAMKQRSAVNHQSLHKQGVQS